MTYNDELITALARDRLETYHREASVARILRPHRRQRLAATIRRVAERIDPETSSEQRGVGRGRYVPN